MIQNLIEMYHFLKTHLFNKKKKAAQNTSKLDEKYNYSSSVSPFDYSSSLKTSALEIAVSDDRLLTADPSKKEVFRKSATRVQVHDHEDFIRPPSAEKILRIHSRRQRAIIPSGSGGFWDAGIETFDLGDQSKDKIDKKEEKEDIEELYSSTLESRRKRIQYEIQRLKSNNESRVEKSESSNLDIQVETILNPLPEDPQDEIKPAQAEPVKLRRSQKNLAEKMFKMESRHKRLQSELIKPNFNSNNKDDSPSIRMGEENLIIEKAEIKRPEIEPERIHLGQIIHKLKSKKRRIEG